MNGLPKGATASTVCCAADGTTVALDTNGHAYLYSVLKSVPASGGEPSNWAKLPGVKWNDVAVGSSRTIVGLVYNKKKDEGYLELYIGNGIYTGLSGTYEGMFGVEMASDNSLICLTRDSITGTHTLHRFSSAGLTHQTIVPETMGPVTAGAGSASQLLWSDNYNNIYRYLGEQSYQAVNALEATDYSRVLPARQLQGPIKGIACCGDPFYFVTTFDGTNYHNYATFND